MLRCVEPVDMTDALRCFDAQGREVVMRASGSQGHGRLVGGGRLEIVDVRFSDELASTFAQFLRDEAANLKDHLGDRCTSGADVQTAPLPVLVEIVHRWARTA